MSFGRHACRQALKPSALPLHDHLWISDDLLAITFRRFANSQRRHGSCVPGPLEARRRLAKRRNTALAGFGAGPAEDIACLFGRNGREHMKWTDHQWQRPQTGVQGSRENSASMAHIPLLLGDQDPGLIDVFAPSDFRAPSPKAHTVSPSDQLKLFLEDSDWGIEDVRDFVHHLRIDLQRYPKFSRQIFDSLLLRSSLDMDQITQILDDPFLNARGSGNYYAAVEMICRTKMKRSSRTAVLRSVCRALELGLLPAGELRLIIKALPHVIAERGQALRIVDPVAVNKHYLAMWKAIGRCNVLGYRDMDSELVGVWLTELLNLRSFRFAEQVIVATHSVHTQNPWAVDLVIAQLAHARITKIAPSFETLFCQLHPDYGVQCIIDVTETLAISVLNDKRVELLEMWQTCLEKLTNVSALTPSQAWLDLPAAYGDVDVAMEAAPTISHTQKQIISRIWALRTLSRSLKPVGTCGSRSTDKPIYFLLGLYETATKHAGGSLLSNLMRGIQNLNLPHSNILLLAVKMKVKKRVGKTTRKTLEQLETSQTALEDVWTNAPVYHGVRNLFFADFDRMFRRLDLTSPEMVEQCLQLARFGSSQSIWSILTILRSHTPFKLCLHKAWTPVPHPSEKALARYHEGLRNSQTPDPHAAVDFVHRLAVAISCSRNLTPLRAFHLVHMLYGYLRRYGGPVYPSLAQAMYHAGVVRYRREGRRVPATQYEYILWIVDKFEGRKASETLRSPARIGQA
ncbi:hypothetical protein N7539_000976 [Penicillium diatomitis]|uniref:Uncharacterized protein n=1 Tax=Penicillium diatomitis TaxID=2819901 RepID=A0A9W9XNT6_9EURO|nr:uncharacterized protein N7539_000976 [Penicillium diatomitis]KAJ5495860.1 hypothetical protein N7539_000976 [Penicillium diatomitis]